MTKITVDKALLEQVVEAMDAVVLSYGTTRSETANFIESKKELRAALAEPAVEPTYTSTQASTCASCGEHKHTPLRIDKMGGYVCLTCIDQKLGSLLGEFGYPEETSAVEPAGLHKEALKLSKILASMCCEGGYDLETLYTHDQADGDAFVVRAADLLAQLAEPAVGPVAVVDASDDGYWAEILPDRGVKVGQLLYASPPLPAEVPLLTDEEVAQCIKDASKGSAINRDGSTSQRIARTVEQAVRQKAGLL